jgi:N-methylhydantoinase B
MGDYAEPAEIITDPIELEILRGQLEAIGQDAGMAVEKTAISTVVSESKDYSVTMCDAAGNLVVCTGAVRMHYGGSAHAVRATIARHGESIEPGDVFVANDPHNGGGLHPQDLVVQRPIFVDGRLVAWSAISAHMMDMGGLAPGSWAPQATECYQEALRVPPVHLFRQGVEVTDVWEIFRNNVRIPDVVEMDMRSMVIGTRVVEEKVSERVRAMGIDRFLAGVRGIDWITGKELRRRVAAIADGTYSSVDTIEWGDEVYRIPCRLEVDGEKLSFDLEGAPPQIPAIINSKAFIMHSVMVDLLQPVLASDLPFTQALYDLIELRCPPGTLVDSTLPAAIASAHMDTPQVAGNLALYCLHLALAASPDAPSRRYLATPQTLSWGVTTWSYQSPGTRQHAFVLPDGVFTGTAAGHDRDGIDLNVRILGNDTMLELPDVEVYEATYPLLFGGRSSRRGINGAGRWHSGGGCEESFRPHGADRLVGNIMGQRGWFPSKGTAGGHPGVNTSFHITRADGRRDQLPMQAANVELAADEWFEISCGAGGGYGDPLDRPAALIVTDVVLGRLDEEEAAQLYGVVVCDGVADLTATETLRQEVRQARLESALPPWNPVPDDLPTVSGDEGDLPLYPGVVQRGPLAVAEDSGAVLAVAPGHWTDGCPRVEQQTVTGPGREYVTRTYLDPVSGRALHVEVALIGDGRTFEALPRRWTAAAPLPTEPAH